MTGKGESFRREAARLLEAAKVAKDASAHDALLQLAEEYHKQADLAEASLGTHSERPSGSAERANAPPREKD